MDCIRITLSELINPKSMLILGIVMVNPLFWNVVSRLEYYTHFMTGTLGGRKRSVALLATGILTLNYFRTTTFHKTMDQHAVCNFMQNDYFEAVGYFIVVVGAILVISSSYRLGFYCSFMGDYFGIFLDDRVTGFPFNVVSDPMYVGSTLVYFGMALQHASIVGLLLTACIGLSYVIAMRFEGPFTTRIYTERQKVVKSS